MLFDPFEEQFYLPTVLIKHCNLIGCEFKIICKEYERRVLIPVIKCNSPEAFRIIFRCVESFQETCLIGHDTCSFIYRIMRLNFKLQVLFGSDYK
ncbi:hypothetical protein SDC9_127411 [bioreactor metagenome]|uniref:Uncharacterized protein n=1 Tax=bioreactor metagenome TaxID=1076179 RepID=A0A645CTX8_9ZZZZ